jgi:hypothetical protein
VAGQGACKRYASCLPGTMKSHPRCLSPLALLAMLALGACHSTPSETDASLLSYVDQRDREAIAEARRDRDEAADAIATARRRVDDAQAELKVARSDLEVQEARRARAGTVARADSRTGEEPRNNQVSEAGYADVDETRKAVARARDTIHWRERLIAAAKEEVEVAEARRDLAEANVELTKALAVARLDRPEARRIDVEHHRRVVREREADLKVAEVRFRAAQEEADIAKEQIGRDQQQREDGAQDRRDRRDEGEPMRSSEVGRERTEREEEAREQQQEREEERLRQR